MESLGQITSIYLRHLIYTVKFLTRKKKTVAGSLTPMYPALKITWVISTKVSN